MSGEITPDTYERDRKANERAEAWLARAVQRLQDHAQVEAEVKELVDSIEASNDTETEETESLTDRVFEIKEIDAQFLAALEESWWRVVGTLADLQYQMELMTKDSSNIEGRLFDDQYHALINMWDIGRQSSQDHSAG